MKFDKKKSKAAALYDACQILMDFFPIVMFSQSFYKEWTRSLRFSLYCTIGGKG